MTDDRSAFTEARTAGKAIHQQQRLDRVQAREDHSPVGIRSTDVGPFVACSCGDNPTPKHWLETHWSGDKAEGMRLVEGLADRATYTEAQVKALTKQAGEFGYALGRKEAREEIAALCEKRLTYTANRGRRLELQELVAELRSKGDPS